MSDFDQSLLVIERNVVGIVVASKNLNSKRAKAKHAHLFLFPATQHNSVIIEAGSIIIYSSTISIMKSFQAVILAAIVASSAAINEPVASPTAAIERELAEYERQLGTDVSPAPTPDGDRVSLQFISYPVKSCLLELQQSNLQSGGVHRRRSI